MAEALAAAGARVAIVGRSEERGQERVRSIEAAGGRAIFQAADALDRDSLAGRATQSSKQWGTVSVLVNGAGGNRPDATLPPGADFCKLPLAGWQGVFDLNLVGGALLPSQVFGETMVAAGRGQHHQHRVDVAHHAAVARGGLFGGQGGGPQPDEIPGARVGDKGRARQRHQPRLFPRRTEPGHAAQAGRQLHRARQRRSSATRRWPASARRTNWPAPSSGWRRRGRRRSSPARTSSWTAGSRR